MSNKELKREVFKEYKELISNGLDKADAILSVLEKERVLVSKQDLIEVLGFFLSHVNRDCIETTELLLCDVENRFEKLWFDGVDTFTSDEKSVSIGEAIQSKNYILLKADSKSTPFKWEDAHFVNKNVLRQKLGEEPKEDPEVEAEFTILCKCGEKIDLYKDGISSLRGAKGWYLKSSSDSKLNVLAEHDELMLFCDYCGSEGWTFT